MAWTIGMSLGAPEGYQWDALRELIREKGFEPGGVYTNFLTEEDTIAHLSQYDALIAGGDPYTQRVLEHFKARGRVKIIARYGVGYDKVDLDAAARLGIPVTNTAGTMSQPVAEMAMALLLCACREVPRFDAEMRRGEWPLHRPFFTLNGKTVGLVGFGGIAREFARYLRPFTDRVLAYDPFFDRAAAEALGVEYAPLDLLTRTSDVVSLHLPLTPETRGLWNREMFEKMKPHSIFINTGRGGTVDERALIWALSNKVIAAAGLDVFEREPIARDNPLLSMPNVVLTPHVASQNEQSELVTGGRALENILDFYQGRVPRNILNPDYQKHIDG